MATYTANYGLHQWVPGDNFLRTDFNTDFQKIDAGIKAALSTAQGKPDIVTGSYTGDDAASRTISLGFQPKAVLLENQDARRRCGDNQIFGGLALPGKPLSAWRSGQTYTPALTITATGFIVAQNSTQEATTNMSGMPYYYLAVK